MKKKKIDYVYAVGRRKTSSARVRLYKGKGESVVNGKPIEHYFPGEIMKSVWSKPFKILDVSEKYYVRVKVLGGGLNGQLDAVVNGISKAFAKDSKKEFRLPLKKAGLLKRDARVRERRKPGTGGKARKKKQSPKR